MTLQTTLESAIDNSPEVKQASGGQASLLSNFGANRSAMASPSSSPLLSVSSQGSNSPKEQHANNAHLAAPHVAAAESSGEDEVAQARPARTSRTHHHTARSHAAAGDDVDRSLLCQLCDEPRAPKDRGQGLHIYCRTHKEIRQQAWRRAAKKYRERKRGVYDEDDDMIEDDDNSEQGGRGAKRPKRSSGSAKKKAPSRASGGGGVAGAARKSGGSHLPINHGVGGGSAASSIIPWPQFWFQKEMMRFVNPAIRQSIKRDFDAFTQGRPGLKTYTYQENYSIEMNAASAAYRKPNACALGKTLYHMEKLMWVEPFVEFLADQWWSTAVAMILEQVGKDEGVEERVRLEKTLADADTIEKKKRILYSLLGSMTMLSYSTEDLPEELLGPKHGHMIMVINIHGDGDLVFRRQGDQEQQPGGKHSFPVSSGDVYCFTGDFRYDMTHKTLLKSDYRCVIILRFWLPGRECYVRMRAPNGAFDGYRRLDKRDKDEDNFGPVPGKRPAGSLQPNVSGMLAAMSAAEEMMAHSYGGDEGEGEEGGGGAAAGNGGYGEEEEEEGEGVDVKAGDEEETAAAAAAPAIASAAAPTSTAPPATTTSTAPSSTTAAVEPVPASGATAVPPAGPAAVEESTRGEGGGERAAAAPPAVEAPTEQVEA